jgi:hypothetical protein
MSTAAAIAEISDPTERAARAVEMFGRNGVAMLPMLEGGAEGLENLRAKATQYGNILSKDVTSAAADFNDTLETIGTAASAAFSVIAVEMLPTMQGLADKFLEITEEWSRGEPNEREKDIKQRRNIIYINIDRLL